MQIALVCRTRHVTRYRHEQKSKPPFCDQDQNGGRPLQEKDDRGVSMRRKTASNLLRMFQLFGQLDGPLLSPLVCVCENQEQQWTNEQLFKSGSLSGTVY